VASKLEEMNHIGLFEGIGGFSLAAQWMGWETVAWVEIDSFCQKVLKQNFPKAKGYGDIKEFNGTEYRGTIDILTGGFPCQPYSTAGKRKGNEDDRHLWPEMRRVIREVQPPWIVGENVRGLTNWNGGLVFDEVQADLETEGYEVTPFLLPACAVNAPHRRDRIWFIGYSDKWSRQKHELQTGWKVFKNNNDGERIITNSRGIELQRRIDEINNEKTNGHALRSYPLDRTAGFKDFPTKPGICGRNDGIPNRAHRIKALGNAVVPQLVFEIFKAIDEQIWINNKKV
jgi:DNA (cytosine-5)-methyltransferase 1